MKISEIAIFDHKQFKEFVVDLTYPEGHPKEGQPLDKVCFIGSNGTGKTTILELLRDGLETLYDFKKNKSIDDYRLIAFKIDVDITNPITQNKLAIYAPADSEENPSLSITDDFGVSLNEALIYFRENIPFYHEVSNHKIKDFWKVLTFHIKKREDEYRNFLNQKENQSRTVAEVNADFDKEHVKILDELAVLWQRVLAKSGLEFDAAGAKIPVQLTDTLKAYIRLKSNKQPIPYNELSTGIRNFIFKVGHIYSLYFNRNIEAGFLMIDEPENSLFPDFLYDVLSIYQEITQNTQIFMATHSPIIAAQFEPCERIILDFNEEGYVFARKGIVPVGDDPNDILVKDFGIRSLLGKEGVEKWERFIELKFLIKAETNIALKAQLINEYMEIGKAYNFGLDLKLKQDEANYQKA